MYLPTLDGQVLTPAQTVLLLDDEQLKTLLTDLDRLTVSLLLAPAPSDEPVVRAWRGAAGVVSVLSLRVGQEATRRGIRHDLMAKFVTRQFMLVRTPGKVYDLPQWWSDPGAHLSLAAGEPVGSEEEVQAATAASAEGPWSTSTDTWWRPLGDDLYVDEGNGRPLENSLRVSWHHQHVFEGGDLDGQERTLEQVLAPKITEPQVLSGYELVGAVMSDDLFAQALCTWKVRKS